MRTVVSQGPPAPAAPSTAGGGVTGALGRDQGSSMLKQILLMAALKDPKHAAWYSTILGMATPSATELKMQKEKEDLDTEKKNKLYKIDQAVNLLEKKKLHTGPLWGRWIGLKTNWDMATSDEVDLNRLVGEIGAREMFEIGGKVLPTQEIERLKPFTPLMTAGTASNIANLKEMKNKINEIYNKYGNDPYYTEEGDTIAPPADSFLEE